MLSMGLFAIDRSKSELSMIQILGREIDTIEPVQLVEIRKQGHCHVIRTRPLHNIMPGIQY